MAGPTFDYETWAEFRYHIRRYLRAAEAAARGHGLEPQQHQLLLAVRGYPGGEVPTIGDIAERLQLRHHSTVELVNRMEQSGLVRRHPTGVGRAVAVRLTPQGRRALDAVSVELQPRLGEAAHDLIGSLSRLVPTEAPPARAAAEPKTPHVARTPRAAAAPRLRPPRGGAAAPDDGAPPRRRDTSNRA